MVSSRVHLGAGREVVPKNEAAGQHRCNVEMKCPLPRASNTPGDHVVFLLLAATLDRTAVRFGLESQTPGTRPLELATELRARSLRVAAEALQLGVAQNAWVTVSLRGVHVTFCIVRSLGVLRTRHGFLTTLPSHLAHGSAKAVCSDVRPDEHVFQYVRYVLEIASRV